MTTKERTETCATCRFWDGRDYVHHSGAESMWFKCRRYAPKQRGWPNVHVSDWCGEWQGDKGESA